MKAKVIKAYGPEAMDDIQVIKASLIKEKKKMKGCLTKIYTRLKEFRLYCFLAAAVVAWYIV